MTGKDPANDYLAAWHRCADKLEKLAIEYQQAKDSDYVLTMRVIDDERSKLIEKMDELETKMTGRFPSLKVD